MTADTPDPRPAPIAENFAGHGSHRPGTVCLACEAVRPVSPPSELTALARLDAWQREHPGALVIGIATVRYMILDAARAAPQTDANLEGYWERAYWEIVPKLEAALVAAPQADAGTASEWHRHVGTWCLVCVNHGAALAASPATAGRPPELPPPDMTLIEGTPENKAWHREHDETP